MIVLDTDHLSVLLGRRTDSQVHLSERLSFAQREDSITATIVSIEEQCRGWLAAIRRAKNVVQQSQAYAHLADLFVFYSDWNILTFTQHAGLEFQRLRKMGIRIGTQDLRIAVIVLEQDALLLSANLRDFKQVPDLRVEDWLAH